MLFEKVVLAHVSASRGIFSELFRSQLYRRALGSMGNNVVIRTGIIIKEPHLIHIGNNVSIQENCYISGWGGVCIGNDVSIGNGTKIVSSEHRFDGEGVIREQELVKCPVSIGNDVWIGMGVCILGGTKIRDRVIIGAGSVVKGVLESGGVYAGVPARRIKEIS